MLIARWLFLLAGLGICMSAAWYVWTRNPAYWRLARRIFFATLSAAIVFFVVLIIERLAIA